MHLRQVDKTWVRNHLYEDLLYNKVGTNHKQAQNKVQL